DVVLYNQEEDGNVTRDKLLHDLQQLDEQYHFKKTLGFIVNGLDLSRTSSNSTVTVPQRRYRQLQRYWSNYRSVLPAYRSTKGHSSVIFH
ncbi:hypothetical protein FRX31_010287, partial [Thalictrum thalictroides]